MDDRLMERTLTAIIVADVVAYSRMMGQDEAGTLRTLTRYRAEVIDPAVVRFGGRVVNAVGDSLLLEFSSVVDATHCAIALQQDLAERNATLAESKRLSLRMGVNIGDVIVQKRELFGDGVNVAARLQTLAEPGGICLSGSAYEHIRGKISAPFVDMGGQQFKNIVDDVRAYRLSASAIAGIARPSPPKAKSSARPLLLTSLLVVGLVLAIGLSVYVWRAAPQRALAAKLDAFLLATQSKLDEKSRAKLIADFLAIGSHRAFAIAPKAQSHWWTGGWATRDDAATKVLERCQLAFNETCQLIAVDDAEVSGSDELTGAARDLSRLSYAGDFDPAQIPAIRPVVAQRSDVVGYLQAAAPKAAALHARGVLAIVTGAATQHRAELQALKLCNNDDSAKDGDGRCVLYAQGNKVVLPLRSTVPITP